MTVREAPARERVGGVPQLDFIARVPPALRSSLEVVPQLSRYGVVSGFALALDVAVFLLANRLLGMPTVAGVIGYACGILLHYHLSFRYVFPPPIAEKSAQRRFGEFLASGLIGLGVTAAVIALATSVFGLGPLSAKLIAMAASFLGVFAIRRTIVFA
jgi:putative flippase GtrA